MIENIYKTKTSEHINKYNFVNEKIELIISTQEFKTSNDYVSNIYIKNKTIIFFK